MPELKEIYDRKKETSGQVSTLTRSLALAFIGVAWTLLTVHDDPLRSMAANVSKYLVLILAATSVLVLICDLLQYVAATNVSDDALRRAEKAPDHRALYEDSSRAYKAQRCLYFAKFYILSAGALVLLVIFILLFQGTSRPPTTPATRCSCERAEVEPPTAEVRKPHLIIG